MMAGSSETAPFVMLDAAVVPLGVGQNERGLLLNWMIEPVGIQASPVGPMAFAGGMRAETPLSPAHLNAVRTSGGVQFSWIRRSRIDADSWEADEIPMDEASERYRVELIDGEAVRRTVEISAAVWFYDAADEIADFGVSQETLTLQVRQLGRIVPSGLPARASFAV